ncbi:hypothetical protein ACQRAV_02200 [Segatella copri]|uniref:hypothetical protein n=1 Tax=Segatella copri TaxID=165179 RepID=UPI003D05D5EE
MFEILIGGAILAVATAVFKAFWDTVYNWCVKLVSRFLESFTTFVKSGMNVISYYYHRKYDGWYREKVPAQTINKSDCPKSVRDALFDNDEVVVQRF